MSENMTSLPSSLSFALSVVQGCSKNVFQIASSTGASSVASDGVIRFNLPSNSIMDWKQSKLNFSVVTKAGTGSRLPQYADTLFSGVRIMVAGQTVVQNNNLHGIVKAVDYVTKQDVCDEVTGHPHVCEGQAVDGSILTTALVSESYGAGIGLVSTLFSVDMGQIARISPRLISMDLLGAVTVEFIVAPASVLIASKTTNQRGVTVAAGNNFTVATGATTSFTIERPVFNAVCYSLLSSSYQMAIKERIASIGYVSFVYPQTTGFVMGAWAGSNRFSLSANSLRKLTSVWRNREHAVITGARPLAGRCAGTIVASMGCDGRDGGGILATAGERHYQGSVQQFRYPNLLPLTDTATVPALGLIAPVPYADFSTTTSPLDFQFQVNSSQYPQYNMGVADCLQMTLDANNIDELHDTPSMQEYLNNKFIVAVGFNLPHKEGDIPCLSGLNTTGQNAYFGLQSVGTGNDSLHYENIILAETDTIMRVGAMRQIEIIN